MVQPTIMDKQIFKEVNEIISSYNNKSIQIVDGLNYNQYQTLKKIEFYWNSQYINGQTDELGRVNIGVEPPPKYSGRCKRISGDTTPKCDLITSV